MEFECVLWYRDARSDKVWGVVSYTGRPVSFWGRRTGELQFKILSEKEAEKLKAKKIGKGYREVTFVDLGPTFEDDLMTKLTLCILSENFFGES
jgi:hypothetical protein